MNIEVKVPPLPESVADARLIAWHHKTGESVRRDENLVDLETDKVVLEVPAPSDGVLIEIKKADGATVTSGEVLAVLQAGKAPEAKGDAKAIGEAPPKAAALSAKPAPPEAQVRPRATQATTAPAAEKEGPQRMGPAVRNLLEEHDIDPAEVSGTGREGRITKTDVLGFLSRRETNAAVEGETATAPATARSGAPRGERRVAMTRLRARIAERLVEAQQTAAMLTTFNEIDMSEVVALRARYQEEFQSHYDIKLGFMSFFVRASIEALRRFPALNASVDGKDIIYHEYFDIGVAVSTDRGLLVPVIRDAESMSFAEIEKTIRDFGERARTGEIGMDDLTGGTFTITNGGIFGSLMSTPILNPPQCGILGMHKIQDRPVAVAGEIKIRPMMYVALTYDHRLVDGREAVQFLVHLKEQLEDPARLVLQI